MTTHPTFRLAVWNCRMALHEKWQALAGLGADVAVVPEVASPDTAFFPDEARSSGQFCWTGPNPKKGLAVFTTGETRLTPSARAEDALPDGRMLAVSGAREFQLLAVWARYPGYVRRLHDVLDAHEADLRQGDSVMAGDFNSNTIWDRLHGKKCHSALVRRLDGLGLVSAYHATRSVAQGAEAEATFHLYARRGPSLAFHIDYVFLPKQWVAEGRVSCTIGAEDPWLGLSDHRPLCVDLAVG